MWTEAHSFDTINAEKLTSLKHSARKSKVLTNHAYKTAKKHSLDLMRGVSLRLFYHIAPAHASPLKVQIFPQGDQCTSIYYKVPLAYTNLHPNGISISLSIFAQPTGL